MSNVFEDFFEEIKKPIPNVKSQSKSNAVLAVEAEYIKKAEIYKTMINKSASLNDKYLIAIELISDLTDDRLFFITNSKLTNKERVNE